MSTVFPQNAMHAIGMDHPLFHTVYDITELKAKHGAPKPLEGVTFTATKGAPSMLV